MLLILTFWACMCIARRGWWYHGPGRSRCSTSASGRRRTGTGWPPARPRRSGWRWATWRAHAPALGTAPGFPTSSSSSSSNNNIRDDHDQQQHQTRQHRQQHRSTSDTTTTDNIGNNIGRVLTRVPGFWLLSAEMYEAVFFPTLISKWSCPRGKTVTSPGYSRLTCAVPTSHVRIQGGWVCRYTRKWHAYTNRTLQQFACVFRV